MSKRTDSTIAKMRTTDRWMTKGSPERQEIETVMQQAEEEAQRKRNVEHEYDHFDFRERHTLAGLQCADLVAWTNYNVSLERVRGTPLNPFAESAWDDFATMPVSSLRSLDKPVEWNFFVSIKPDHLKDWARREIADGRSLIQFREWEAKKTALTARKA